MSPTTTESALPTSIAPEYSRLLLLIEEFKTMREEIGRFQNQQKQLITAGLIAIGGTLWSGFYKDGQLNVLEHPLLFLLAPILLGPLSILFFETEINIYRAARYICGPLEQRARLLCGGLETEAFGWEFFRALHEKEAPWKMANLPWSQTILFILPALACLGLFVVLDWPYLYPPTAFLEHHKGTKGYGAILAVFVDLIIIIAYFAQWRKARTAALLLDQDIKHPEQVAANLSLQTTPGA